MSIKHFDEDFRIVKLREKYCSISIEIFPKHKQSWYVILTFFRIKSFLENTVHILKLFFAFICVFNIISH